MEGNILLKERTQTMNNKIKLHILGLPSTGSAPFPNTHLNFTLPME